MACQDNCSQGRRRCPTPDQCSSDEPVFGWLEWLICLIGIAVIGGMVAGVGFTSLPILGSL